MLLSVFARQRGLPRFVVLLTLLAWLTPWATGTPAPARAAGAHATPACDGPRDLIVDGVQITLSGARTFDAVCIIAGATVIAQHLTLRAGMLFVDAVSRIDADGLPGGPAGDVDCSPTGNAHAGGDTGSPLMILARQAIVAGKISSNGGAANTDSCAEYQSGEDGGQGGQLTLEAGTLTFTGSLSAQGGSGGTTVAGNGGNGGAGGAIQVLVPAGAAQQIGQLNVRGGSPGTPSGKAGRAGGAGQAGHAALATLTAAQETALPPPPAPLVQPLGRQPTLLPLQSATAFGTAPCGGAGDLDVGRGVTTRLDGVQRFTHVCVHDGGVLTTSGHLTLIATTISVDAASRITADGVIGTPAAGVPAGTTTGAGSGTLTRAAPHAGTPGTAGTAADVCCGGTSQPPVGGAGGGAITLVAQKILLAGTLSADGAHGKAGDDGFGTPSNCATGGQGAGGGSGGGIFIRAGTLQLSGTIRVAGGIGGMGGSDDCDTLGTGRVDGGAHGGPGFVTLLVDTLRVPAGPLPVDGPAALGHTLPVDPAPPTDAPGARYFATAGSGPRAPLLGHSLAGPFLAFFGRYGGLATFGYPRTESFSEGGRLVQYTERFRLELVGSQVVTGALGRVLTAGRHFPTVAPFASTSTRRYFPATGHSLSGRFLAYWLAHDGAILLGAPIAEETQEANGDGSGRTYRLQWFERGRLEYHPELAGTPYAIQLGLLGTQALEQRGWLP